MKLIPPPPPVRDSELAVSQRTVVVTLRHGVLSGCIMCGHSTGLYWPHESCFHPLHEGCIPRLFEHWSAMLATLDEAEAGPRVAPQRSVRTGRSAYARRASAAAAPAPTASATAPRIPEAVQANPWWRPGLGPDVPWMVVTESTVGRKHVPCNDRVRGEHVMQHQRSLAGQDRDDGVILLGGALVGPDAAIVADWGVYAPPFGPPLYRPLGKVGGGNADVWGWERCRGCDEWMWPGRWIVDSDRLCGSCAAPDDDGRPWPIEPPSVLSEPPPPPPKSKAKGKPETFD